MHERFRTGLEVAEEMPIALGLGLLEATEHGVPLVDRLARQQRLQEHDGIADGFEVGEKIRTGDAEQHGDIVTFGQGCIDADTTLRDVAERDHDWRVAFGTEDSSHKKSATFSVEHGFQHLDRPYRSFAPMGEAPFEVFGQRLRVRAAVRIRHLERIVLQQPVEAVGERIADRIAVSCHRMGDAIGRLDAQRDELDVGIDAAGLEEAPGQRVVVGLIELAVEQSGNFGIERELDAGPDRALAGAFAQGLQQGVAGFGHATVVHLDALDQVGLHRRPLAPLETAACALRDVAETTVVVVEAGAQLGGGVLGEDIGHGRDRGGWTHHRIAYLSRVRKRRSDRCLRNP